MISALESKGWEIDDPSHLIRSGDEIFVDFSHPDYPSCNLILAINIHLHGASVSLELNSEGDSCIWYDDEIDLGIATETAKKWQKNN